MKRIILVVSLIFALLLAGCTSEQLLSQGTYVQGQEVIVDGEKFFVLEDNGNMVTLLAKYCLNQAGTEQDKMLSNHPSGLGRKFSNSNYWSEDFTSSPFDLQTPEMIEKAKADAEGIEINNAILTAQAYGIAKGGTGRLLTYEEAIALGCKGYDPREEVSPTSLGLCPDWVFGYGESYSGKEATADEYQSYWLGSAANVNYVWYMTRALDGGHLATGVSWGWEYMGVRPVLEISKSFVSLDNNNENSYELINTGTDDSESKPTNTLQFKTFSLDIDTLDIYVRDAWAKLKKTHAMNGEDVTDEQIYMEIATGSSINSGMIKDCVNISDISNKLSIELPEVNGSKKGWYITSNGKVFNVSGVEHLGDTFFSISVYEKGVKSYKDNDIEMAQKITKAILNDSYEVK